MSIMTIVTGVSSAKADEAIKWLVEKGATTEEANGLTVVRLPEERFNICRTGTRDLYTIGFIDVDGNEDFDACVEVLLCIDAGQTELTLDRHPF